MRALQRSTKPLNLLDWHCCLTHTLFQMKTHILIPLYINTHTQHTSFSFPLCPAAREFKRPQIHNFFPSHPKSSEHGSSPGFHPQAWLIVPDEDLTEKEKGRRQNVRVCVCKIGWEQGELWIVYVYSDLFKLLSQHVAVYRLSVCNLLSDRVLTCECFSLFISHSLSLCVCVCVLCWSSIIMLWSLH